MSSYTIVERLPEHSNYHCGYCDNDTAHSRGMWAHTMNAEDYQALIDRGWRRSGQYCYKPTMDKTCCPQYTIRCEMLNYKPTNSKKKVIRKMRSFLMTEDDRDILKWKEKHSKTTNPDSMTPQPPKDTQVSMECGISQNASDLVASAKQESNKEIFKGLGPDPSKPKCRKAKVVRQERRMLKNSSLESGDAAGSSNAPSSEFYQMKLPHLINSNFKRKLEVRTVKACKDDPEFRRYKDESYALYKKYQTTIHGDSPDECTEKQWQRFLVSCPLNRDRGGPGPGYGNYHQQYVLDGKMIAVGVIDILPKCVSSVYLYYDPDYGFLTLGVYCALSEITFAQTLHLESPLLTAYYMGFYIHECQKMRYKKEYPPSYLLCPETYEWVPVQYCLDALDKNKYCRLNIYNGGTLTAVDMDRGVRDDVDEIRILYQRTIMNYLQYASLRYCRIAFAESSNQADNDDKTRETALQRNKMNEEVTDLMDYMAAVGTKCASRMLLFRDDE